MSEEHKRVRGEERMTIIDAMRDPQLFGSWFRGKSWESWRVFLKALFGLDLSGRELDTFRQFTGRNITPEETTEAWLIVGRRGGKSLIAALVAVFLGCFRDYSKYLAPGERGTLMAKLGLEPGSRERPVPISGCSRNTESFGRLLERQSGEIPKFEDVCGRGIGLVQPA